jgi:hypothetical protein
MSLTKVHIPQQVHGLLATKFIIQSHRLQAISAGYVLLLELLGHGNLTEQSRHR